jgi:hypothetical protein
MKIRIRSSEFKIYVRPLIAEEIMIPCLVSIFLALEIRENVVKTRND